MPNPWITRAEELAESRRKSLAVDLHQALATGDHDAARNALINAADIDDWFTAQDVVAYW
ncbi:hypothetical protein ACFYPZ_30320 [Streptomyces sp. NPDC005506]|uniref:hypothetical protein n=1 Tax=unclassified Streptomyces TaxID=2593676 RepID=UPI00369C6A66